MKKNSNNLIIAILSIISIALASCGKPADKTHENGKDGKTDSMPTERALQPLPDTAYASVEHLEFKVDIFDSIHNGTISDMHDMYVNAPGIFTFRGGPYRDAKFHGTVKGRPDSIAVDWTFRTSYDGRKTSFGVWGGGTGWTGQPLYVCWPDSCMKKIKQTSPCPPTLVFQRGDYRRLPRRESIFY